MDFKLESREGFLLVTAAGRASLNQAIEMYRKACDVAAAQGFDKILVQCLGVEANLSNLESYEFGRTIAEYCLSQSRYPKVATVGKPPVINEFAALVARNRGLTAETFSEIQPALDWLNRLGSQATEASSTW